MQNQGPENIEAAPRLLPWHEWAALAAVFVVVVVAYWGAMSGPFFFDDLRVIPYNPAIKLQDLTLGSVRAVIASTARPVSTLSFALNFYFGGYDVTGYRVTNIVLHLLTGLFLYLFLNQTMQLPSLREQGKRLYWLPLAAASLWLVHPLQTQTVSYIVQRMNGMAAMFYVLSMYFYVRARVSGRQLAGWGWFAGCCTAGVLALKSKEIAATLPCMIFLYEWYFMRDLDRRWAKWAVSGVVGVVIILGVLVYLNPRSGLTWMIQKGYGLYDFNMTQRVLTELRVVVLYISLVLFPHPGRLNLDYDFPLSYSLFNPPSTVFALFVLVGLLVFAVRMAKADRLLSFCILWFLVNLVIESSVIPLDLVFEHRLYLPSMLAIVGLILLMERMGYAVKKYGLVALVLVFFVFSFWSWQRNNLWGNPLAMYLDCVEKSPGKPRPVYNVACEYAKRGDAEEAVLWLEKVVKFQGFNRWDLIKHDRDLRPIRNTEAFKSFYDRYVPVEPER